MRPQMELRARRACAVAAALGLTYTVSIDVPASASGDAGASGGPVPARLSSKRALRFGQRVIVRGSVGAGLAGVPLALEYRAPGSSSWSVVATTTSSATGSYRLSAAVLRSGALRVAEMPAAGTASVIAFRSAVPSSPNVVSASLPLRVRAGLRLGRSALNVLAGHRAAVSGSVRPARGGRLVALQVRSGRRWKTVARDRTGAGGRYRLSYTPSQTGSEQARVSFSGDDENAPSQRSIGRLNAFRLAEASWYGPGGQTACGETLTSSTQGVASKTLPCGTLVTLRYGGHTVRVPVIDRGPYVAGRDFDLTIATKEALGFPDLGAVWSTA